MFEVLNTFTKNRPGLKKNLVGLLVSLVFCALVSLLYFFNFFAGFQLFTSDILRTNFTLKPTDDSDIVYLLITDATIIEADEVDGIQWPWPRQAYGEAIKFLKNAGAKAIVFDIIFSETSREGPEDDEAFAEKIKMGDVILANLSTNNRGNISMEKIARNEELMSRFAIPVELRDFQSNIEEFKYFRPPVETLLNAAEKVGDVKFLPDSDGVGRRNPMLIRSGEHYYPTMSFSVAAKVLGFEKVLLTNHEMILSGDRAKRRIPLDNEGMAWLKYYGDSSVYKKYLLLRVIKSQVKIEEGEEPYYDPALFKDKVVILATDSTGLKDLRPNPFNKFNDTGGHYHGTAIDNIIRGEFLTAYLEPGLVIPVLLLLSILTAGMTSNFNAYTGFAFTLFLVIIYLATSVFLYRYYDILIEISATSINIIGSFTLLCLVNYIVEAQQKRFITDVFGQYLSPGIIKQLIQDPSKLKLGGEKRIMTAYFSDVAGFSTISEKLSPEKLVLLLNDYLSEMCEIIARYHGTVDKFEGDAIIAFWGAPIPTEEHALLACKASLEMDRKLVEIRKKLKEQGKDELYVRMGLNSGPMVVGNMGSKKRMDFTIMGDSVNLAARLEGANKFYGTYLMISEFTYEFVKNEIEVRELDLIRVIGKNKPVRIYELLALKGALSQNKKKGIEIFENALLTYKRKKFEEAIKEFKKVFDFIPEDPPSNIYLKRCLEFTKNQPKPDWDGVYQLTEKG